MSKFLAWVRSWFHTEVKAVEQKYEDSGLKGKVDAKVSTIGADVDAKVKAEASTAMTAVQKKVAEAIAVETKRLEAEAIGAIREKLNTGYIPDTADPRDHVYGIAAKPTQPAPTPAAPAPVVTAPTPAAPAPVQSAPTPAAPAPVVTAPAPAQPAPAQPASTPAAPAPVVTDPTPAAPAPVVTAPAPAQPAPVPAAPAPAQPAPTPAAPAPVQVPSPASAQPAPTPAAPAPVQTPPAPPPVSSGPIITPTMVDLTPMFKTPIEDQGHMSSCVSHAVTSTLEAVLGVGDLSRLFIYWNARSFEGTTTQDAGCMNRSGIRAAVRYGSPPESYWPYSQSAWPTKPDDPSYAAGAAIDTQFSYATVTTLALLKKALSNSLPVIFGFSTPDYFRSTTRATGVLAYPGPGTSFVGGHCVVAVGFDDSTGMVKCRNSFGTAFGQGGYFYMPYQWFANMNDLVADAWVLQKK